MLLYLWYRYEVWLAIAILVCGLWSPPLQLAGGRYLGRIARRRWWAIGFVGAVALVGCLGISLARGLPQPAIHDEFAYLLQADTFAQGRLTNPPHPLAKFFDTFHILQSPTYASKYPPAQAIFMALGQVTTGYPIVGVWLSFVLACAATCWMLQAWLPPRWALIGALFLTARLLLTFFANHWAYGFWGGAVTALGGALLFGAGRRLYQRPSVVQACLLALGLLTLANSRPFEGFVTCVPMMLLLVWRYLVARPWRFTLSLTRVAVPSIFVLAIGFAWMAYYNHAVTGNWKTFPYSIHLRSYMTTPLFAWTSARATPEYSHPDLARFYMGTDHRDWERQQTWVGWLVMTRYRLYDFARLYTGWLLLPALIVGLVTRRPWCWFMIATCGLLMTIELLITWVQPHYFASVAAPLAFLTTMGMRRLWWWRIGEEYRVRAMLQLAAICYGFLLLSCIIPIGQLPNPGFRKDRARVLSELIAQGGKHLVVVRYTSAHDPNHEWVFNAADIDHSQVIWAREFSPEEQDQLLEYYPDRQIWLLEADRQPYILRPLRSPLSAEQSHGGGVNESGGNAARQPGGGST